jgi:hypothetical protein
MTNRERTIELREIDQAHSRQLAADVAAGFGGGQDIGGMTPDQKLRKKDLNQLAERMGITTKAGKRVFREGRAALTQGVVTKDQTGRLAENFGITTKKGRAVLAEGRRALDPSFNARQLGGA